LLVKFWLRHGTWRMTQWHSGGVDEFIMAIGADGSAKMGADDSGQG
jgi:hypothetical protein